MNRAQSNTERPWHALTWFVWAIAATASAATPITSATYTGLGASEITAAAASAHTNHTPACHVARATGVAGASVGAGTAARGCVVVATAD